MSTVAITDLTSWGQRFAVIQAAGLTDEQVMIAFGIDEDELDTARDLLKRGDITVDTSFNIEPYKQALTAPQMATKRTKKAVQSDPEKQRVLRIANAFKHIPTEPMALDEFLAKYPVSTNVLRQGTRFDTSGFGGRISIRKTKQSGGQIMIWRNFERDTKGNIVKEETSSTN